MIMQSRLGLEEQERNQLLEITQRHIKALEKESIEIE